MVQFFSQATAVLFGLFGLSVLVSKSGFTLFYSLVVLFGLFKFKWNIIPRLPLLEKWLIALFPVAVGLSFFSSGGPPIALEVLTRWTWPLIYFPIVYLHEHKEPRIMFFKGLCLGLFIACLYSYWRFFDEYSFIYDGSNRVASFWDILRWAYFCAMAATIFFSLLIKKDFIDQKSWKILFVLFVMALISLLLTSSRGAWICALFGMLCALIVQRKNFKYYVVYGALVFAFLLMSSNIRNRIFSSFSVKTQGGQVTSEVGSNAARLNMWMVALDLYQYVPMFGVGFQNSNYALRMFIGQRGPLYAQTYVDKEYSYHDQHSSYLSLLLQFGGIYFVFIYGLLFIVAYKARRQEMLVPALLGSYLVYFFYSAIMSFESVIVFGLISFMLVNLRKTKV